MKISSGKTSIILDLVFCLVFMPALMILGTAQFRTESPLFFLFLVAAFYYIAYFVLRHPSVVALFMQRKYLRLSIVLTLLAAGNFLLTLFPLPEVEFVTPLFSAYQTAVRDYNVNISLWLMFSLVVAFAVSVSFDRAIYRQQLLKHDVENQWNKARLAMFKAQISPHFLFNTINTIYSLILGSGKKAEDAVLKFAEIMRYAYITAEDDKVRLGEELRYIKNYIDLQSLRLDHHTRVIWKCDVAIGEGAMIPPMLLLTFVENAFKYGSSSSQDCEIYIVAGFMNGHLHFSTRNNVMRRYDEFRKDVPVGIENCRFRLKTLFPGHHSLTTEEKNGIYIVNLDIDIASFNNQN